MFRYFYNSTGAIVGRVFFKRTCTVTSMVEQTTYVDSEQRVNPDEYHVVAGNLVPISEIQ